MKSENILMKNKIIKNDDEENKNTFRTKHHTYDVKSTAVVDHHPKIEGYDFEQPFDFQKFLASLGTTGFQATHLAEGIEIVKAMEREKATIFLAFTSNQISSGNREIIKYLVKNKKVHVLITSAGGIEEDIIKSLKPFVLGKFEASGRALFENGINRTGNIFVPNDRFAYFEQWMQPVFEKVYQMQKNTEKLQGHGKVICPKDFIRELGLAIKDENSVLYWAAKNDIPVFCPGLIDGSLGDLIFFYKQSHPDFLIDVTQEMKDIVQLTLNCEKTGGIILGGGISKHFALNANIFREGFDFVVDINTAQEYDEVKATAPSVKIHCDATIAFPLLVAGALA
ncbi:deoxyhypusine synthase family protein [Candidatus Woesearchaeota archaeon]|nr:deoxyhypusine synthase family protein [Candidatus Woesearchaeota archaeon]